MGNRYEIDQWLAFITAPHEPSKELIKLKNEFQDAVAALWDDTFSSLYPSSYDDLAYNTYASFSGMGVGLWEGDEAGHVEFEPIAMQDKNLQNLSQRIQYAIYENQFKETD